MDSGQTTSSHGQPKLTAAGGNEVGHVLREVKLASLWATFRNILKVVVLIFVFAVLQMLILWRVCDSGMKTANSLQQQGLPNLDQLASLQEHIVLFRLYSYEYLFAKENERAGKAKAAELVQTQIRSELENIKLLLPPGQGQQLAIKLETSCSELAREFGTVRSLVDTDFAAAMKAMDQDIPPRIETVTQSVNQLKEFGYHFSGEEAQATFSSFRWIKQNAIAFGSGNIAVAFGAVIFVVIAARRSRKQLSEALARLDERTGELAKSASLINATLESTPDGVLAIDRTGRIVAFNQNFVKMWGMQTRELTDQSAETIQKFCSIQTANPGGFSQRFNDLQASPETEHFEVIDFQDGRAVEQLAKPQWIGDRCVGTVLNFRDITERKRAEAELAYERDLLKALLETCPDIICFKDLQSRFVRVSKSKLQKSFEFHRGLHPASESREGTDGMPQHLASLEEYSKYLVGRTNFDFYREDSARALHEQEQHIIRTGEAQLGKLHQLVLANGEKIWVLNSTVPWKDKEGEVIGTFGISTDITAIKQAEAELELLHRQLVDASRMAGMAEVATNVLHNVGNVLNSVNISTTLIRDSLKKSKISNVGKVAGLMQKHLANLGAFLTSDPAGKQLPEYIASLAEHLDAERNTLIQEAEQVRKNVDHIIQIVAMQQSHVSGGAVVEKVKIVDLIEDALHMNVGSFSRHEVQIVREYETDKSESNLERHKLLQILVNLIRNAILACNDSDRADKRVTIRLSNGNEQVQIAVIDNGVGISPENMTRIFNHGFTTRQGKGGHGFGLHGAALAAKEMGGALAVSSEGPQRGAVFTVQLPLEAPKSKR